MALFNFKPARSVEVPDDCKIVTDLDKMVSQKIAFKWNGSTHFINPISTETWLDFLNAMAGLSMALESVRKGEKDSQDKLLKQYGCIFSLVCDSIKPEDVYNMTQHQVAALMNVITKCLSGEPFVENEKKKMDLQTPISGTTVSNPVS
jgi:hypothetical protein